MLKNFFKVTFRNITRHKGFSFLNIAGLTFGLTACILIVLFVIDEKKYDRHIPDGDRIYRMYVNWTSEETNQLMAIVPPVFAPTLKQQFPEVENTTRISRIFAKGLVEYGDKQIYQEGAAMVDSTFFDLFPLQFVYGSSAGALNNPTSMLISEELSQKIFGKSDPTGKNLFINKDTFQVKGVFKNHPKFHLKFGYILPMQVLINQIPAERMKSWGWQQFFTYVKLKKGAGIQGLQSKFQQLAQKEGTAFERKEGNDKYELTPYFQSLHDVHLHSSSFKHDMAIRGNATYVWALTIIAIFILLIACFNFVNLATAKSLQRAKEVGVRKTVGASRKQLMFQFVAETIFLVFISIVISLILTFILLPWLNVFTAKQMEFPIFTNPVVILLLLLLTVTVGVLAGFYPALVLSGFQPVKVLKASVITNEGAGKIPWLRHGLVVVQFSICVLLIICAIVVYKQVNYLHNKDLGFNKEQIMFFPMRGDNMYDNYETFKNELQKVSGVSTVSIGYGFPGDATAGDGIIVPMKGEEKRMPATQLLVDHDYIKTLGLKIIAGRDFSKDIPTDANHAFIINETAVKEMGFGTPENAIGKPLMWPVWESQQQDSMKKGQIIGVVKDFHFKSLYDRLETTVLQIYPPAYWKVAVKFNTANVENTISQVRNIWNKFSPGYPIEYIFLDDNFEQMYKAEDKLRTLLWIFTGIAIFVGCLGLFGLAAYAAERRKKEIGIRKVLGATVQGVVVLLSKDFVKLVLISLLIASPIAWYLMNKWLQDFAFRINISWWIFLAAAFISISIALLTVSFQAIKASLANPVKNLRTE